MKMGQKRDFVRIDKVIELEYKVIIDKFASTAIPPNLTKTATISGNGLTFMSPKKIDKGTRLEMRLDIPGKSVDMAGEVINIKQKGPGEFEAVVKFVEIDEPDRDRLVKYILREGIKAKPKSKK
jgi:c-di-GMP-binding flagellar brake protein YcgR